jgi:hypothetical protein
MKKVLLDLCKSLEENPRFAFAEYPNVIATPYSSSKFLRQSTV